jgi:hypothetical protein
MNAFDIVKSLELEKEYSIGKKLSDPISLMVEKKIEAYHKKANFITHRLAKLCKLCSQKRMILDKETGEMRFVDCSDFCVYFQITQKELNELYEDSMKEFPLNLGKEFLGKESAELPPTAIKFKPHKTQKGVKNERHKDFCHDCG